MASSYTLLENDGVITSAVNTLQGSWIAIRNRKETKWAPIPPEFLVPVDRLPPVVSIPKVQAKDFEPPPGTGPTRLTASNEQRESGPETPAGRLTQANAEPRALPPNAIKCSQAQVARFFGQAQCGGLIKSLEKQGDLSFQVRRGGKFRVVFANEDDHVKFKAFVNEESQKRRAKRRNQSRK